MKLLISLTLIYFTLAAAIVFHGIAIALPVLCLGLICHRHPGAAGIVLASILGLGLDGLGSGSIGPCLFAYSWMACAWQPWISGSPRMQSIAWPAAVFATCFCDQLYRWSFQTWLDARMDVNRFSWTSTTYGSLSTAIVAAIGFIVWRGLVDIIQPERSRLVLGNQWRRITEH